jgi:hypothetical protein
MKNIFVTAFVILALISGVVNAQDNIERKKIDFLISSVTAVRNTRFVSSTTHLNY